MSAKIREIEFKINKAEEKVMLIPVRLTEIDELRTEMDEIKQELNLDRVKLIKLFQNVQKQFANDDEGYLFEKSRIENRFEILLYVS